MLDRARDAEREVQRRLDDLAGLADLLGVRDPAGVDRGAGRTDGAAERLGELLDDPEAVRPADAAAAGDDDPRLLDRRGAAGRLDAVDDGDLRAAGARRTTAAVSTVPAAAAGSAVTDVRADGDDPAVAA